MTVLQQLSDAGNMEARYQRAQYLMQGMESTKVAPNTTLFPVWIEDSGCFWYVRESRQGKTCRLVDARSATYCGITG